TNTTDTITWTWASGGAQKDYYAWTTSPADNSGWITGVSWAQSSLTANSTYTFYVKARNEDLDETSSVNTSAFTSQNTPTDISFDTIANDTITLSAQGTFNNLTTGSAGLYFLNTTNSATPDWLQTNSWANSSLSPNTQYTYQVKARNGDADETSYCTATSTYTLANAPGTPTFSNVSTSTLKVIIALNSNPTGTEFAIYENSAAKYVNSSTGALDQASEDWQNYTTWGSASGFTITGLAEETSYTFKAKARNGNNIETAFSSTAATTTTLSPPTAPSDATLDTITSTSMRLTWTDNASTETGFKIEQSADGSAYTQIATALSNATSSSISSLTPNTQYYFRVRAFNIGGNSAYSTASAKYTLANAPASLTAAADSSTQITASWSANSNSSATQYYVLNTTASTTSDWITATSWVNTSLTCATSYTFKVKAKNGDGTETAYTDTTSATTSACPASCGDGTCNGTETCSSCSADCGVCPSLGGGIPGSASGNIPTPQPQIISPDGTVTYIKAEEEPAAGSVPETKPSGGISEILKPLLPEFLKPQPKPEEIKPKEVPLEELVPGQAPLALKGKWDLLPAEPIASFVLSPLPNEIRKLAEKFPELKKTFQEIGITKITDIERLKNMNLTLSGLKEAEKIPSDIVFAQTAEGLIDHNINLSISDKGEPQQTISTISNQNIRLVTKPDKPVKSIKGYVVFKSKQPGQTSFQIPLSRLASSLIFAFPTFAKDYNPEEIEERLVIIEFEYTDPDGDGIYTADIKTPIVEGEYEIITVMDYEDPELGTKEIRLITVVDPEGYIYEKEGNKETRIPGAIASLFWLNPETKQYQLWPAKEYQQENPQTTDVRGTYSFFVPEGFYYLKVEAPGYLVYDGKSFQAKEGSGIHDNIEIKAKNWWLKYFDWKTILLIAVILLLLYNFYKDRIREKLMQKS
ncbi:fibronectin type III domain-containing protein, partial [Patescibacteria group bacterium]|nr:fibronectin type III domain-containing protein [Patescibacteria group bacterium]